MPLHDYDIDPITGVRTRRKRKLADPTNPPRIPSLAGVNGDSGDDDGLSDLDKTLVSESQADILDKNRRPDTLASMGEQFGQAERRYKQSLGDVIQNLKSEAIRRNVYTSGGELDRGTAENFERVYATPLGEFTRSLALDAAKQQYENRQQSIRTGQGISSAQASSRLGKATLAAGERQFDVSQSGMLNGTPTLARTGQEADITLKGRVQTEEERRNKTQEEFATGQSVGTIGGRATLAGRGQALAEEVERGRLGLSGRAQTEEERRNKATETLQARGVVVTEQSLGEEIRRNKAQETLQTRGVAVTEQSLGEEVRRNKAQETLQSRGVAVTEQSLGEEVRRNKAQEALQARGVSVTERTLNEEVRRTRTQEILESNKIFGEGLVSPDGRPVEIRNGRDAYDMNGNYIGRYDTKDGMLQLQDGRTLDVRKSTLSAQAQKEEVRRNGAIELLQGRQITEEERRNKATEVLQSRGMTVTERSLNEEVRQNNIKEIFTARQLSGEERRAIVQEDLTKRGQDINNASINAQIRQQDRALSQKEIEMFGGSTTRNADGSLSFHPTAEFQLRTDAQKLGYAHLTEETRANKAREDAAFQERTGIAVGIPGTIAFSDFNKDFGKTTGFDPRNDFNNDGQVDIEDYFIGRDQGKIVENNKTMNTVQKNQADQNIKQSAAAIDMDEKEFELKSKVFFDSVSKWKSDFSGVLWDENGEVTREETTYEDRTVNIGAFNLSTGVGTLDDGTQIHVTGQDSVLASDGRMLGSVTPDRTGFTDAGGNLVPFPTGRPETRRVPTGTRRVRIEGVQLQAIKDRREQFEKELAFQIDKFEKELEFDKKKLNSEQRRTFLDRISNLAQIILDKIPVGKRKPATLAKK